MKKNDFVNMTITGMTTEGNGVGRADDMAVFVPFTAVGDEVRVKITKVLKSYAFGIVDEIIKASDTRCENNCEAFLKCGGCSFRHISYENELIIKKNFVSDAFKRIGKLQIEPSEIIGCENSDNYRNKAQYPVAELDGRIVCGFYSRRSHRVVPFTSCKLQPTIFQHIADFIIEYVNKTDINAYDEITQKGYLRHIYLRRAYHTGEIMVCLVVTNNCEKKLTQLCERLIDNFSDIKSIVLNINKDKTNVIMGSKCIVIAGSDTITDKMCGNKIELSPLSFYQVNTPQAEKLYDIAKSYAQLTGNEKVLDLYCGAGTIGLSFADKAKSVIGVEIIPEAIENAKRNARLNDIKNTEFFCGDASDIAERLAGNGERPDVIVLDPPRKGCDTATLDAVARMSPQRIVMISCNPATAARDVAYLETLGYISKKACAVDLFPRTTHVETCILLSREIKKSNYDFR